MSITKELPIGEKDVKLTDNRKVAELPANKLKEIIEYVEHLEDSLRNSEFELERDQVLVNILLREIKNSYNIINEWRTYLPWYAAVIPGETAETEIQQAVENGEIGVRQSEMLEDFIELIRSLRSGTADHNEGAAEGSAGA
jgi:hypothetical protein